MVSESQRKNHSIMTHLFYRTDVSIRKLLIPRDK